MRKILKARYVNGSLILEENLDSEFEEKMLQVMVLEDSITHEMEQPESAEEARARIKRFIEKSNQFSAKRLPDDEPSEDESAKKTKRQRFLEAAAKHSFELPSDYKFDRNELYDR